jgi:hypothetical protein
MTMSVAEWLTRVRSGSLPMNLGVKAEVVSLLEAEWLACCDPEPMLAFLRGRASDRKVRLFGVACCRRIWHLLGDERSRWAVEVAEGFADGLVTAQQLHACWEAVWTASPPWYQPVCKSVRLPFDWSCVDVPIPRPEQALLLRDIVGDPFRRVTCHPSWATWNGGTVPDLAQVIYDDRAFDRLPILADALEDAGCDDAEILTDCRSGGDHVRGCWVVDLLLGKE